MKKQTIVKDDGRLLTYYWFTRGSRDAHSNARDGKPRRESKSKTSK